QLLLTEDIIEAYPHLKNSNYQDKSLSDLLMQTGDEFIFILDEWDYIFGAKLFVEKQSAFLRFLMNLLKDKSYVALCYMTGVLPIKNYSDTSDLNMFNEFTFLRDRKFENYFGFTEEEVKVLCNKNQSVSFNELENWYNGYSTVNDIKLYNPRSVISALENNYCESYWTNTGSMSGVLEYLKYNILDVRDDVIKMVSGEEIEINIDEEFRAGQNHPKTREEIYSAMIVLGFLSYCDGYLKIPNKELMKEFEKALKDDSFGVVSKIVNDSKKLLDATINCDAKTVEALLHNVHNSEIPILQYNDENSLACVVNIAYLSARDYYRIEREEKTGKGYADFMFHPKRKNRTGIIIELKKDDSVDNAINQIKEKEYAQKLRAEGRCRKILAVAICYDSKTKEHHCKIEEID
ncbi:MAG: AAA family ATPase, partial [Intestinibacter sp.]